MDYLKEISKRCKNSVSVNINQHRDYYQSALQRINERDEWFSDVPEDVLGTMIDTDTIVEV